MASILRLPVPGHCRASYCGGGGLLLLGSIPRRPFSVEVLALGPRGPELARRIVHLTCVTVSQCLSKRPFKGVFFVCGLLYC